jgi:glycosyltransferase involved in cell wall biosynthesis
MVGLPRRADVLLWESPPLFLAPAAWLLAKRLGARLVMNVSDLWPKAAVDLGVLKDRRLRAFFESWEAWAYSSAALVTHQTEGLGAGIRSRSPGTRTLLFPNGVDLEHFRRRPVDPVLRRELGIPEGHLVVGYGGNFGRAQAMHQIVDAAAHLKGRDVTFLLLGAGPCRPEVELRARDLGLSNVLFRDPLPKSRMPDVQSLWDVSVVPLADAPLMHESRPSKMFELMAMEVPFVFCGQGEGADIALASEAATVVGAERPEALAWALARWLDAGQKSRCEAGRRGRAFVAEHFDRARIADALEAGLINLVAT